MFTEEEVIDQIMINEDGHVHVRKATVIKKDGKEITRTFHRHVLTPGDDVTNEDAKVKAVIPAVWTQEVLAKEAAKKPKK